MSILIENVSKNFGQSTVLCQINLEIIKGKITALLGPSGSGKSTLLRIIAGFEKPDIGRVWFNGKNSIFLTIQQRRIGFVFQDYILFPKMTVLENISFGLKLQKNSTERIDSQTEELLNLIQLENFSNFYPYQLSGGQKQRVAFARALALNPKILLLDEPFGALDIKIKKSLRLWLKKLQNRLALTIIFVTHDIHEAMEISDEIIILKNGRVEQLGTPLELYKYPSTNFIKNFLGIDRKI